MYSCFLCNGACILRGSGNCIMSGTHEIIAMTLMCENFINILVGCCLLGALPLASNEVVSEGPLTHTHTHTHTQWQMYQKDL